MLTSTFKQKGIILSLNTKIKGNYTWEYNQALFLLYLAKTHFSSC